VNDLTLIAIAVGMSTLIMFAAVLITQPLLAGFRLACPRTVPLIAGLLTGLAVGGLRLGVRGLYQWGQRQSPPGGRRVLIVGAGEAGAMAAREMRANPQLNLEPVAFVDDDPEKHGVHIHGLPVLGGCPDIPRLVRQYRFQRIIVAVPSMSRPRRQEILALCAQTGLPTDSLPGIYELLAGSKAISALPPVDIHRLLRRPPIFTDTTDIAATVAGQTVLVTGAGGSIGSELCRQVARMKPKCLILLGRGENSIFEITLDLRLSFPHLTTRPVILDVRNAAEVAWVVEEYRPGLIFHAAAHKHVPFMEGNAKEAVTNNILGTYNVLAAAEQYGVPRLVMISTDKAVNPTSIMGATKRLAELLVMAAARRTGRAYMAVRFGNVLGSRGSVIPVFQRQIAAGGPVTVTHPDMTRYFMTIPEAVQLVLQAPVLGSGGEVFVLDMGKPVRILDLATDLVKLAGFEVGRDIEIAFSGIRPGEKIYEELFLDGEEYRRTCHAKIFRAIQTGSMPAEAAGQMVMELVGLARQIKDRDANEQMRILIPNICFYVDKYQPCGCKPAPTPPAEVTPSTLQPAISRQWSVVSR
jgi:FlaA1/EpsC-like NDP-sugar epimerase